MKAKAVIYAVLGVVSATQMVSLVPLIFRLPSLPVDPFFLLLISLCFILFTFATVLCFGLAYFIWQEKIS